MPKLQYSDERMIIMSYTCPSCKSDNIQKATMTHVSGISKTKGIGIGVGMTGGPLGGLGGGIGVGKATNQTMLSQMTTPPKISSPIGPASGKFLLIFLPSAFLGMLLVVILADSFENMIVRQIFAIISTTLIFLFILFLSVRGAYKAFRKAKSENDEIITAYNEQYICLRCGSVFRLRQS